MAISLEQLDGMWILCKTGTFGGITYYVGTPELGWRPSCLRRIREGDGKQYCSRRAGERTPNNEFDEGACRFHGGANNGGIANGRYADVTKRRMKRMYEKFQAEDAKALDLLPELALQRTLLAEVMDALQGTGSRHRDMELAAALLRDINRSVETIERIESNKVLTQATLNLIMAEAMATFAEFVQPGRLGEFRETWRMRVATKYPALAPPQEDEP